MSRLAQIPLAEVCTIIGGGTPRRSNAAYFDGTIPWATPTDVTALDSLFIEETKETISEVGLNESSARLVPAGTVLMTSRATIGYAAVATRSMATNQGFANLICGRRILPEYLAYWLRNQREHLIQLAGGTTFRELPKSTLKKVCIPLPPLDEQRRIVGILNRAARIERLRRQAQERLQEFVPALFVKMFGDPAINPMGWETAPLGNVCTIVGGGTPSRKVQQYWRGNIPWISVKDFRSDLISEAEEFISKDGLKNSASKIVSPGTLLLVTRVGLGKVAMAGMDLAINQDIKAIMPHNHVLPEFLLWSLKHLGPEIASKGTGATVKGVTLQYVKELEILLPPLSNQQHFVDLVKRSRSICTRTAARSATATALSASLMSRLLEDCP